MDDPGKIQGIYKPSVITKAAVLICGLIFARFQSQ